MEIIDQLEKIVTLKTRKDAGFYRLPVFVIKVHQQGTLENERH